MVYCCVTARSAPEAAAGEPIDRRGHGGPKRQSTMADDTATARRGDSPRRSTVSAWTVSSTLLTGASRSARRRRSRVAAMLRGRRRGHVGQRCRLKAGPAGTYEGEGDRPAGGGRARTGPVDAQVTVVLRGRRRDRDRQGSGVVVHPAPGNPDGTLVNGLLARFPELVGVGETHLAEGIVHRLDAGTSGLLAVARTLPSPRCSLRGTRQAAGHPRVPRALVGPPGEHRRA